MSFPNISFCQRLSTELYIEILKILLELRIDLIIAVCAFNMDALSTHSFLDNFQLDILGQQPRINRLYTQLTFCFSLSDNSSHSQSEIVETLSEGLERVSENFPWVAGKVVNENGRFKIKPFGRALHLVIKTFGQDSSVPNWDTIRRANFPYSMLDESIIAPYRTLAVSDRSDSELPVFAIQANFIPDGLLLTFNGQHGSMDMTGQGQIIYLLAKACRNEPFTSPELSVGNMGRKVIIPLLDDCTPSPELGHSTLKDSLDGGDKPTQPQSQPPKCTWAYFLFPATSLAALKSLAMNAVTPGSFVSTDDVLSAFTWQSITRARLPRLGTPSALSSTLSRNVDVRRYLSIPSTYPGLVSNATTHTSVIDTLIKEPLGRIASQLRSALDPESLSHKTRALATLISRGHTDKASFAGTSVPELDVRLSSWAKENCYDLDFGFGKPEAVRRPRFVNGSRQGLVYFLPRTLDGEIAVGVCLSEEDMERLKGDEEFARFGTYIG